ncbi:glycosyltransferase [Algoriphagus algorifonticola]|uniref:glycosyltransferase n=1 Tax=Algoriphagus algorifonticola TaxID=2593007 RepID=UPI002022E67A|nr:glycosyltransferase [Algoriphagus algorifonticola]
MSKKIKVLHLIKSLGRGGAEKLIPETASVHDQLKFEFHCLYFYHQQENIIDELERAGIQVHHIPSGNLGLFFQVKKVSSFIRENNFDLIHAHLPWAGILARFVGLNVSIPIVYTEHNTWDRYNKVSYWGNRLTFKKQDLAIAVSNEVALSMQLNSIWDPYKRGGRLKIRVVQNGVNTEVFFKKRETRGEKREMRSEKRETRGEKREMRGEKREMRSENEVKKSERLEARSERQEARDERQEARGEKREIRDEMREKVVGVESFSIKEQLGIPASSKVIGKVAVFRSQKRLWLWVEVAIRILKKHPTTHFLLVGDGEWRERLESQIKDSGFEENFHLVGVQKEVIPYLNLMDIYLSSSEFEGLPIAMLEAMACEIPVVATRAGGIGEVIQHGKQGFLCHVDEWEYLEGFCIQLLEEEELLMKMGEEARKQVEQKFSMQRMVKELEKIYQEVLG